MYKSIAVGFAFFTIATILGAFWAAEAWGGYWSWDPKETWALIVWLNYAAWLHMRLMKGLRGTVSAWWALVGLVVTTFAFLGVNMFLSGLHSYGDLVARRRVTGSSLATNSSERINSRERHFMLIQSRDNGFQHPIASEITPRQVYEAPARPAEAAGRWRRRRGAGRLGRARRAGAGGARQAGAALPAPAARSPAR